MHHSMAQYRIQAVIIEETNRVRTEKRIGKKQLQRRRQIPINTVFCTSVVDARRYRSKKVGHSKLVRIQIIK